MKRSIVFFIIIFSNILSAQDCYPFNLNILQSQSAVEDSIKPVFKDGSFVFTNILNGRKVIDKKFQEAYPFFHKVAIVKYNDQYNLVDREGIFLIDKNLPDEWNRPYYSRNTLVFRDFQYFYGAQNKEYVPASEREYSKSKFLEVYKSEESGKYGFTVTDRFNKEICPSRYDSIISLSENFILAKIDKKYGLENNTAHTVIPYDYDGALLFNKEQNNQVHQKFLGFKKRKNWFYFDWNGNLILKSKHEVSVLSNYSDVIGAVKKNGKFSILYRDGVLKDFLFDRVSENVNIGFIGNDVYYINSNKTMSVYYSYDPEQKFDKISIREVSPYGYWSELVINENTMTFKDSENKGEMVKTDPKAWMKLYELFGWCDYIGLKESGNRTKVDGTDIFVRIYKDGISIPKYTPEFYGESEKMGDFGNLLMNFREHGVVKD